MRSDDQGIRAEAISFILHAEAKGVAILPSPTSYALILRKVGAITAADFQEISGRIKAAVVADNERLKPWVFAEACLRLDPTDEGLTFIDQEAPDVLEKAADYHRRVLLAFKGGDRGGVVTVSTLYRNVINAVVMGVNERRREAS